jgi:hypothetical protein
MTRTQFIEFLPELDVEGGALLATPTAPLPSVDPLGQPLDEVLRVADEPNPARPVEKTQAVNGSEQLHAVVRRALLAAGTLTLDAVDTKDEAPPAGPRIAGAGSICEEFCVEGGRGAIRA